MANPSKKKSDSAERADADAAKKTVDVTAVAAAVTADKPAPVAVDAIAEAVKAAPSKSKPARVKAKTPVKQSVVTAQPAPVSPKLADPVVPSAPPVPVVDAAPVKAVRPAQQEPIASPPLPVQTPTQPKETVMETATETTTPDFTASLGNVGADMQGRLKAAYDKMTGMGTEMTDLAKGNVEAAVESGKVLASGMQDLGRSAVEDAKNAYETMTADVKQMAAVKSPTELMQLQGELARRNFDAMIAQTSKNTEAMMKLMNDAFAPISNRISIAIEKAKAA